MILITHRGMERWCSAAAPTPHHAGENLFDCPENSFSAFIFKITEKANFFATLARPA